MSLLRSVQILDRMLGDDGQTELEQLKQSNKMLEERIRNLLQPSPQVNYEVLCHPAAQELADDIVASDITRFCMHKTTWETFPDTTDNIQIDDMNSARKNTLARRHVLFVASFHNSTSTLSQLHLLTYLCELRPASLTVLLPFFPTGTLERIAFGEEGIVPTANTLAMMLNGMPSLGQPLRIMTYDIHALQEQFYFHNHAGITLHSAIHQLIRYLEKEKKNINCIVFPDDGAKKRFGKMFGKPFNIVTCIKQHTGKGDEKEVKVEDGTSESKHVLIVDDMTRSGNTMFECIGAVSNAASISMYVTHAAFTEAFWDNFRKKAMSTIDKFYITNSVSCTPSNTPIPKKISEEGLNAKFEIISLAPQVINDL